MEEYMTKAGCDEKHRELLRAVEKLSDRLYKDNGTLSMQSRLGRMEIYWKLLSILTIILTTAVTAEAVRRIFGG